MPQLDFYYYISQTTWLIITFTILHIILKQGIYQYIKEYYYLYNIKLYKQIGKQQNTINYFTPIY